MSSWYKEKESREEAHTSPSKPWPRPDRRTITQFVPWTHKLQGLGSVIHSTHPPKIQSPCRETIDIGGQLVDSTILGLSTLVKTTPVDKITGKRHHTLPFILFYPSLISFSYNLKCSSSARPLTLLLIPPFLL